MHIIPKALIFCYATVFRYLAEKYLQKLKQRIMEDPEVVHTSSNRIGMYTVACCKQTLLCHFTFVKLAFGHSINAT